MSSTYAVVFVMFIMILALLALMAVSDKGGSATE